MADLELLAVLDRTRSARTALDRAAPRPRSVGEGRLRFGETAHRRVSDHGGTAQRVVLIGFPSEEMKTIELVTRTLVDRRTAEELAVVYVPTSPNSTSGSIEIVPMSKVVPKDWTLDDAMRFAIGGGATAPGNIDFAVDTTGGIRQWPGALYGPPDLSDGRQDRLPGGYGQ